MARAMELRDFKVEASGDMKKMFLAPQVLSWEYFGKSQAQVVDKKSRRKAKEIKWTMVTWALSSTPTEGISPVLPHDWKLMVPISELGEV